MSKNVEELIRKLISDETKISANEILSTSSFFELGLDSISAVYLLSKLESELDVEINPIYFWDYPTVGSFAAQLEKDIQKK